MPNLYAIRPSGISTAPVVAAGSRFVATLTGAQKAKTLYDVRADQWLDWSNVHSFPRRGLRLRDMTAAQQAAAQALLRSAPSPRALRTSTDIRRLNHVAGRLLGQLDRFDQDLYFLTVRAVGPTEPWGFQFQGHHLVLNCFVLSDQVVLSPGFPGSEPRVGYYDDGTGIDLFTVGLSG